MWKQNKKKKNIWTNKFYTCIKKCYESNFKKLKTKTLALGFNDGQTINQYIQNLVKDTEKMPDILALKHLLLWYTRKYQKSKTQTQEIFYSKDNNANS
jgi:hypothetical protein